MRFLLIGGAITIGLAAVFAAVGGDASGDFPRAVYFSAVLIGAAVTLAGRR